MFDHLDTLVHPYLFLDGVYLKRSWGGEVHESSVLVAIGVNSEGYRKILGVAEGSCEDKESWSNFLRYLKERGLKGVKLVISDKAAGLVDVLGDFFQKAQWQRCVVHWYRNAFEITSVTKAPRRTARSCTIRALYSIEGGSAPPCLIYRSLPASFWRKSIKLLRFL